MAVWSPGAATSFRSPWERLIDFYRPTAWVFLTAFAPALGIWCVYAHASWKALPEILAWAAGVGAGMATYAAIRFAFLMRRNSDPSLSDTHDPLPGTRVRVQLFTGPYLYGEDRGELTLVDDWLIFEGERTGFSLAPHDIEWPRRRPKTLNRHAVDFRLRGIPAFVRVKIVAEDPYTDPEGTLSAWLGHAVRVPSTSVLPPLEPMPVSVGGHVVDLSARQFGLSIATLVLATAVMVLCGSSSSLGGRIVFSGGFSLCVFLPMGAQEFVGRRQALQALETARRQLPTDDPPSLPQPTPEWEASKKMRS